MSIWSCAVVFNHALRYIISPLKIITRRVRVAVIHSFIYRCTCYLVVNIFWLNIWFCFYARFWVRDVEVMNLYVGKWNIVKQTKAEVDCKSLVVICFKIRKMLNVLYVTFTYSCNRNWYITVWTEVSVNMYYKYSVYPSSSFQISFGSGFGTLHGLLHCGLAVISYA